mgnify:CR=1 FL=1
MALFIFSLSCHTLLNNLLIRAIEKCSDSASQMQKAAQIINQKYPLIEWVPDSGLFQG